MTDRKTAEARTAAAVLRFFMSLILNVVFYAVAAFVIMQLARTAYSFSYQVFGSQVMDNAPGKNITITVNEGDTMQDVAETLQQQKMIVNRYSFCVRAVLTKKEIHPGTYKVNSSQNYAEILEILDTE